MSCRSKRETEPPPPPQPQPFPSSSASINQAPPGFSERVGFRLQPASMNAMPGAAAPVPWCGGLPVPPQVAMSGSNSCWWPSPSTATGVAMSGSQATQKDDIDPDLQEWGMDNRPPGGFVRLISNPTVRVSKSHVQPQQLINLDNDDDNGNCARIDRRLGWTAKEEEHLVRCWKRTEHLA